MSTTGIVASVIVGVAALGLLASVLAGVDLSRRHRDGRSWFAEPWRVHLALLLGAVYGLGLVTAAWYALACRRHTATVTTPARTPVVDEVGRRRVGIARRLSGVATAFVTVRRLHLAQGTGSPIDAVLPMPR